MATFLGFVLSTSQGPVKAPMTGIEMHELFETAAPPTLGLTSGGLNCI